MQTNWRHVYARIKQEQRKNRQIAQRSRIIAGELILDHHYNENCKSYKYLTEQNQRRDQHYRNIDGAPNRLESGGAQGRNQICEGSDWVSWLQSHIHCANFTFMFRPLFFLAPQRKFLFVRETRNHNLIDKKLAQTNKKIVDVKRKCTEATKHCLQMQLENVSRKVFYARCGHVKVLNCLHGRSLGLIHCYVTIWLIVPKRFVNSIKKNVTQPQKCPPSIFPLFRLMKPHPNISLV